MSRKTNMIVAGVLSAAAAGTAAIAYRRHKNSKSDLSHEIGEAQDSITSGFADEPAASKGDSGASRSKHLSRKAKKRLQSSTGHSR